MSCFICAALCSNRILLSLMFFLIMGLNHIFSVYAELSLLLFDFLALTGREQEILKAHFLFVRIKHSVTDMHNVWRRGREEHYRDWFCLLLMSCFLLKLTPRWGNMYRAAHRSQGLNHTQYISDLRFLFVLVSGKSFGCKLSLPVYTR